jgi:hypothetical protein
MTGGGFGAVRVAESLLRTVGGASVLLRMSLPPAPGDPGEQLGLATPLFEDTPLGPAVLRRLRARVGVGSNSVRAAEYELLVSAAAVEQIVGSLAFDSASVLFASAAGLLIEGDVYTITSATAVRAFDAILLWRIGLEGRAALAL